MKPTSIVMLSSLGADLLDFASKSKQTRTETAPYGEPYSKREGSHEEVLLEDELKDIIVEAPLHGFSHGYHLWRII